jgi:hypothetical protein
MKLGAAIVALAMATALLCAAPASAAGLSPASGFVAGVADLNADLALLGQGSGRFGSHEKRIVSQLKFENHDGYTIRVIALEQTVALSVIRRGRGREPMITTYFAHGKVTPSSIRASFADRGRIALRFRSSGRVIRASRRAGCRRPSKQVIGRFGVFVGELRFRGEGGYTSAEVHRARGGSIDFAALVACFLGVAPRPHLTLPRATLPMGLDRLGFGAVGRGTAPAAPGATTHPRRGPKPTILLADEKLPLSRTIFAARVRGHDGARFLALQAGSEGSIGIVRLATASAPASSFAAADTLAHARLRPPRPFSGEGAFEHGPGNEKTWSGPLAVSFLGAPHLSLTGPSFRTLLVRGF